MKSFFQTCHYCGQTFPASELEHIGSGFIICKDAGKCQDRVDTYERTKKEKRVEIAILMLGENAAGELVDLCEPFDHWVEGFKQVVREQSKYGICAPVENFTDDQIMAIYLYLYETHIQVRYPNGRLDMVKFAEPTLPGAMRQKLKWLEEERAIRIKELGEVEKALGIPDPVEEKHKAEMARIEAE